ncbi:MAG: class II aldolase/adducin family protein [Candidatus Omnitrophica bacterium]|nr:class II aldolase/adducin family protein [Candidatus Omnitrophota bacterium]
MDSTKTLIKYGKKAIKDKLVIALGGNISIRQKDHILIKAKGVSLSTSKAENYIKVFIDVGADLCVCPKQEKPSSEVAFHLACYKARKDINAVVHVHPVFSTAVANSNIKLECVSYEEAAALCSQIIRSKYFPSGSIALAKEIGKCVKTHNAILMPNHGSITVGKDLGQAYTRALAVERACQTLVASRSLGTMKFLPKNEAKRIIEIYNWV